MPKVTEVPMTITQAHHLDELNFLAMAESIGLPRKNMYKISEVALATGVPSSTLALEADAGRLTVLLPLGRVRGRLIKPEWVDAWMEASTRRAVER